MPKKPPFEAACHKNGKRVVFLVVFFFFATNFSPFLNLSIMAPELSELERSIREHIEAYQSFAFA